MQSTNTPGKFPTPFATNGLKNNIPENGTPPNPNNATMDTGFPPVTMQPLAAGGLPPYGQDMNGILEAVTKALRWAQAGGMYTFDASFCNNANVAGYPRGAVLLSASLDSTWLNTTEGNTSNPDTGGAGWIQLPLSIASDLAEGDGSTLVGFLQNGTGATYRTVFQKLRDTISVKDFGATGNGSTDDTAAIQAAIDATPKGCTVFFPPGVYKITYAITVTKPMVILGPGPGQILEGYSTPDNGSYIVQTNTSEMAFKLVASLNNYAFGQYGICGVHFQDLCIQGANLANKIVACIGVDTSVNGGDFHIRGNSVTRCNLRYATDALNFTGIAYLNNFYQSNFIFSTRGVKIARGSASDSGGQTRFFGCLLGFCVTGASLNEDTVNGVFSFFGCTISDNTGSGISTNDEVSLECSGNNFENNTISGIYVLTPSGKSNSNSTHFRNICGNEFYSNGASIWFDKQATSYSDGNFNYPTRIDSNSFADALALKLTVPSSHPGFCANNFVLGASNTGTNNGALSASQISQIFFGTDEKKREYSLRFTFDGSYVSGSVIALLPIGLIPQSVRIYLTTNATSFSQFTLGDIVNSSRYASFNAQSQTLNTWVSWTPTIPQLVIDPSTNQLRLIGTGGILGAAGVIEVQGYVT